MERSSDRAIERSGKRAIERPSDQAIERSSDQAIERSSERAIERSGDRAYVSVENVKFASPWPGRVRSYVLVSGYWLFPPTARPGLRI